MTMVVSKRKRKKSLAHGRSVIAAAEKASTLSSKATKSLINKHHQLNKQLAKAERDCDTVKIERLRNELSNEGGLERYQSASITGQSLLRGGDSSKVLVDWLKPHLRSEPLTVRKVRVLEVGALSIDNAISKVPNVEMTRIDLNSQHTDITSQDFMAMSTPSSTVDSFDIVSLSLVVNYVPDPEGRGEMLKRVGSFLRRSAPESEDGGTRVMPTGALPALFLVLPGPCVTNSRYMTEERLNEIMNKLGYVRMERKLSARLVYYLWHYAGSTSAAGTVPKRKVNDGHTRNNFCIVLR